jgi:hypothetical protein
MVFILGAPNAGRVRGRRPVNSLDYIFFLKYVCVLFRVDSQYNLVYEPLAPRIRECPGVGRTPHQSAVPAAQFRRAIRLR